MFQFFCRLSAAIVLWTAGEDCMIHIGLIPWVFSYRWHFIQYCFSIKLRHLVKTAESGFVVQTREAAM